MSVFAKNFMYSTVLSETIIHHRSKEYSGEAAERFAYDLQKKVILIKQTLSKTPGVPGELISVAREIEIALEEIQFRFEGREEVDADRDRQAQRSEKNTPGTSQEHEERIPGWMGNSKDVPRGDVLTGIPERRGGGQRQRVEESHHRTCQQGPAIGWGIRLGFG